MNIILGGALGRMGQEMRKLAAGGAFGIACGVDFAPGCGADFPVYPDYPSVKENGDCIVDFSRPSSLDGLLKLALSRRIPAVLCATGYTDEDLARIEATSGKIPLLRSSNMSLGVNVLTALCEEAAGVLKGFDIEITETHHRMKADAPSGTAIMLRDAVFSGLGEERPWVYGREGKSCPRQNEIGIHSLRGGGVVGEHTVGFYGFGEELFLTHRAEDRGLFAAGAAKAAAWLVGKPAGLYSMRDYVKEIINAKA